MILAGAGTGKTRVISRRAAYAIETGVVPANKVLLVTFTDKAANEMVERMCRPGPPGRHGAHLPLARRPPAAPLLAQPPRRRRIRPRSSTRSCRSSARWRAACPATTASRRPRTSPTRSSGPRSAASRPTSGSSERRQDRAPIPADLFARIYAGYERAKQRQGTGRLRGHARADRRAARVVTTRRATSSRPRRRWISVDEYQDTNPLQERLLELWLGDSRDLAVVGDPDQTIYTFTGATPDYLLRFADKHPGAKTIALTQNYRSTPQVLAFANRLTAGGPRGALTTDRPAGPEPTIDRFAGPEVEIAAVVAGIRRLVGAGTKESEIAVLVRINAQLPPIEDELTRAGIPYTVRGQRFYQRNEVREARQLLRRSEIAATGNALVVAVRDLFKKRLGYEPDAETIGEEARERAASLDLLLTIAADLVEAQRRRWRGGPDGRAGSPGRGGGGSAGPRRQPAHVPPGEGPRVGRGLPAAGGGGDAAHPPGQDGRAGGRGAPAALRGHNPRTNAPGNFVVAQAVAVPGGDPSADGSHHPVSRRSGAARGLTKCRIGRGSSTLASRPREARRNARLRDRPRLDAVRHR